MFLACTSFNLHGDLQSKPAPCLLRKGTTCSIPANSGLGLLRLSLHQMRPCDAGLDDTLGACKVHLDRDCSGLMLRRASCRVAR